VGAVRAEAFVAPANESALPWHAPMPPVREWCGSRFVSASRNAAAWEKSGAIGHLATFFHLQAVGWAAGCALTGCLLGSVCSGALADRFGRKKALYGCAACFALSSAGVWLAATFPRYVFWRIVGGIGIGAASIVAPMYIAEIAPAAIRGRLVVSYQFGIVTGILSAVFVNLLIEKSGDEAWNNAHGWRWMFEAGAVPAALFALAFLFAKESPRWLMKLGRVGEADAVLAEVQGPVIAQEETLVIRDSLAAEEGGLKERIAGPFRRPLLIGFLLAAFSQASGITALLSFLPRCSQTAGEKTADAFFQSVLVGVVNLAFTAGAIWLVNRAGRKTKHDPMSTGVVKLEDLAYHERTLPRESRDAEENDILPAFREYALPLVGSIPRHAKLARNSVPGSRGNTND